jgi:hypothetical protein
MSFFDYFMIITKLMFYFKKNNYKKYTQNINTTDIKYLK